MIGKPFINEVLSNAIELYLKYKDKSEDPIFQSFLVVTIRTLVFLYGELDILNPYITQNEHNMGGFDNNLTKFGFSKDKLADFKEQYVLFYEAEKKQSKPNIPFIKIEKYLIDMFFCKKKMMNLDENNYNEFKSLLYLKENSNPYFQKTIEQYIENDNELSLYFESKEFESQHNFVLEKVKRNTLISDAYTLLGYSKEQIENLPDTDLQAVNNQVYKFFMVDSSLANKDDLLLKAVNYYKRYGNRITTGNGYVDFLLFASVFATAIFLAVLFAFNYL